ncbi:unnamed protein product [Amoebophrya sp. A120]|nr:unnamed protein product [Amoebophrya sp. A120]|eukprot:GSA120T00024253001.1
MSEPEDSWMKQYDVMVQDGRGAIYCTKTHVEEITNWCAAAMLSLQDKDKRVAFNAVAENASRLVRDLLVEYQRHIKIVDKNGQEVRGPPDAFNVELAALAPSLAKKTWTTQTTGSSPGAQDDEIEPVIRADAVEYKHDKDKEPTRKTTLKAVVLLSQELGKQLSVVCNMYEQLQCAVTKLQEEDALVDRAAPTASHQGSSDDRRDLGTDNVLLVQGGSPSRTKKGGLNLPSPDHKNAVALELPQPSMAASHCRNVPESGKHPEILSEEEPIASKAAGIGFGRPSESASDDSHSSADDEVDQRITGITLGASKRRTDAPYSPDPDWNSPAQQQQTRFQRKRIKPMKYYASSSSAVANKTQGMTDQEDKMNTVKTKQNNTTSSASSNLNLKLSESTLAQPAFVGQPNNSGDIPGSAFLPESRDYSNKSGLKGRTPTTRTTSQPLFGCSLSSHLQDPAVSNAKSQNSPEPGHVIPPAPSAEQPARAKDFAAIAAEIDDMSLLPPESGKMTKTQAGNGKKPAVAEAEPGHLVGEIKNKNQIEKMKEDTIKQTPIGQITDPAAATLKEEGVDKEGNKATSTSGKSSTGLEESQAVGPAATGNKNNHSAILDAPNANDEIQQVLATEQQLIKTSVDAILAEYNNGGIPQSLGEGSFGQVMRVSTAEKGDVAVKLTKLRRGLLTKVGRGTQSEVWDFCGSTERREVLREAVLMDDMHTIKDELTALGRYFPDSLQTSVLPATLYFCEADTATWMEILVLVLPLVDGLLKPGDAFLAQLREFEEQVAGSGLIAVREWVHALLDALNWLFQSCEGVHFDLCFENILTSVKSTSNTQMVGGKTLVPKLSDFGKVRRVGSNGDGDVYGNSDNAGASRLTPKSRRPNVTATTDFPALALAMCEMIAGFHIVEYFSFETGHAATYATHGAAIRAVAAGLQSVPTEIPLTAAEPQVLDNTANVETVKTFGEENALLIQSRLATEASFGRAAIEMHSAIIADLFNERKPAGYEAHRGLIPATAAGPEIIPKLPTLFSDNVTAMKKRFVRHGSKKGVKVEITEQLERVVKEGVAKSIECAINTGNTNDNGSDIAHEA